MRDYAAISKRLRRYSENCVAYKLDADFADAVSVAADAIEELLDELTTIRKQLPHWISVEERLPEQYKPVIVSYVGYNTNSLFSDMVAYRDGDGDWCWWDGEFPSGEICKVKITHWMPLPTPPKEVE